MSKALLVLSDGVVFEGEGFGSEGETIGEVVFNTSMTGYQEILTDASYKGQIVTMTYPQIGNYGINEEDIESQGGIKAEGFIVKEVCEFPSNWRSQISLIEYMKKSNIVGIQGIDTRALTRHLRNHGAQMGIISTVDSKPESLLEKVRKHPGISAFDLVKEVTTSKQYKWEEGCWKWQPADAEIQNSKFKTQNSKNSKLQTQNSNPPLPPFTKGGLGGIKVVVYDFGIKFNILRNLVDAGFDVTVVPAQTPAEKVLEMNSDGIVLSNGPGDPQTVTYAIESTKKLMGKKPIFGICLGHQILGLAMGGRTYKLKFGHHGGNHPVKDLSTGRVEITSQNHNYCVDINSLKGQVKLTHKNLYDGTEEGMQHVELPIFSVQYHPEAGPGPNDSDHLFKRFREMIER
ncbi:MAG: glutamine-hydrolyzing carbamoyl-phosphate synthase small subunit [Thermodesulfovibrionales bacterium]|nr:glutamine-hydrolyzing carbamoyl-phosphate synthase small subunit [Nitrospinota bacterium]MCG2709285.1 glutamine-hydrolyzing carbamoyl-phosphate synthase small subunit [Thermodesulfovibrionales bacterium]MDP3049468.1 glutamine-hydrolyzing carbamoyl-phosphate synthase small subunit [Thermodesulfovibrionales bacterium]